MSDQSDGNRFETLAIHAGEQHGGAAADGRRGSLAAVSDPGLEDLARWLEGGAPDPFRGAGQPPPVPVLEERLAALEGGSAAVAFASAQAARFAAFHVLLQPGDEIVASNRIGAAALARFERDCRRLGWQVRWADPEAPDSFIDILSDRTRAIFVESLWSNGEGITDLEMVARVAQRARVPLVVDNSWATPYLLRPLEHGADIVLHAADFLAGSGAGRGGLIVDGGTFDWAADPRYLAISGRTDGDLVIGEVFGNFAFAMACRLFGANGLGLSLAAREASLIIHGIETLALRMQRHSDNALAVARHLARHPAVSRLRYPGLDRDHARAGHYCPKGTGAVLSVTLAGGAPAADFASRLRLFALTGEASLSRSRVAVGRQEGVQLSIGLEDKADIITDLDQALAT